jgi:pyridoxamine 5'-phosphate oxidase family protein
VGADGKGQCICLRRQGDAAQVTIGMSTLDAIAAADPSGLKRHPSRLPHLRAATSRGMLAILHVGEQTVRRSPAGKEQRPTVGLRERSKGSPMGVFTDLEVEYLQSQRLARLATASASGQPDVSAVGFGVDGDAIVSGGLDLTKTVRFGHLTDNPRATIVIDDLASVDPWRPRGVKVRGSVSIEEQELLVRNHHGLIVINPHSLDPYHPR